MEIVHVYQKKRREFGRQCVFSDRKAKDVVDIQPQEEEKKNYMFKNPCEVAVQCAKEFSEHEVNTETKEYTDTGMNHKEGGWPKDVDHNEVEQVLRYRKKAEKEEKFPVAILSLAETMETFIMQNNAIDIYEEYFPEESESASLDAPSAQMLNVFRDPNDPPRSISSLSWYPDGGRKLAAAYSILEFQKAPTNISYHSYIWDLENPNAPELALTPSSPLVSIRYNPKDVHILLGGLYNGQVAIWDTRRGSRPIETSPVEQSHRDPVYGAEFLASKTGTEFFTTSTDGIVKWWDTRKLAEPIEELNLDVTGQALGGVSLDFESTMPTRYMIGTEQGVIINGNKKAKTPQEKLQQTFDAHHGPVYALKRNPFFPKFFLSVGDWTSRVFCEDIRESSIMSSKNYPCYLTGCAWSASRPAVAFTSRADGCVDVWDYLFKQMEPVLSVQVSNTSSVTSVACEDSGRLLACGCSDGSISLLEMNNTLSQPIQNEKPLMAALFERELSREKVLASRLRELALKERVKSSKPQQTEEAPVDDEDDPIAEAEENFWGSVDPEKWSEMKAKRMSLLQQKENNSDQQQTD
eukprot:m.72507 g.72507  ORF g.72507 m.72507 type:complete len:579 (+) comp11741_c0_seq1:115-1851(+)